MLQLQERQQADVNYLCVRGSVYTETFTLASPHSRKKALFKLVLGVSLFCFVLFIAACEWK